MLSSPLDHKPERDRRRLASLAGGVAVSYLILLGISLAQKTRVPSPPVPVEELRAIYMPELPPPPPETAIRTTPPTRLFQFRESPSPGLIKIKASPAPMEPDTRPTAEPDFTFALNDFRPTTDQRDVNVAADHVFRRSEVDQLPIPLFQKMPVLPPGILFGVEDPRVTLLFAVEPDGSVDLVRLLRSAAEELDVVMIETIKEWKFRPAIRQGRKVACWVQQPFNVTRKVGDDRGFADFK